jgi:hypothetical protein
MTGVTLAQAFCFVGLGCLWMGWLVLANAPLPRQLRRGPTPVAEKGTPEAFGLFWMDQYGWFGVTLSVLGVVLPVLAFQGFV